MRVTKFVHSCLLVEHEDKAVLIDPGVFSWPHIDMDGLPPLDAVLITHIHPDHYHPEALKQLRTRFPEAAFLANKQVIGQMLKDEITANAQKLVFVDQENTTHAKLIFAETPRNSIFHVFDRLTHLGDNLSPQKSMAALAFPITAPWGSFWANVDHVVKLKPRIALPMHDWHWNEEARQSSYAMAKEVLNERGIQFVALETGISVELDV